MFKEGKANPVLENLWAHLPAKEGDKIALTPAHNALDLQKIMLTTVSAVH